MGVPQLTPPHLFLDVAEVQRRPVGVSVPHPPVHLGHPVPGRHPDISHGTAQDFVPDLSLTLSLELEHARFELVLGGVGG